MKPWSSNHRPRLEKSNGTVAAAFTLIEFLVVIATIFNGGLRRFLI